MNVDDLLRSSDPATITADERAEHDLAAIMRVGPVRRVLPAGARWGIGLAAVAAIIGAILLVKPVVLPAPQGDYPYYASSQELEAAASLVIVGEVLSSRPDSEQGIDYTAFTVRVVADAADAHEIGSTLEVKVMSGNVAEVGPDLLIGGRYVLFGSEYDDSPASLLNPWQGAYWVKDGEVLAHPDNPVRLEADLLARLGLD